MGENILYTCIKYWNRLKALFSTSSWSVFYNKRNYCILFYMTPKLYIIFINSCAVLHVHVLEVDIRSNVYCSFDLLHSQGWRLLCDCVCDCVWVLFSWLGEVGVVMEGNVLCWPFIIYIFSSLMFSFYWSGAWCNVESLFYFESVAFKSRNS